MNVWCSKRKVRIAKVNTMLLLLPIYSFSDSISLNTTNTNSKKGTVWLIQM